MEKRPFQKEIQINTSRDSLTIIEEIAKKVNTSVHFAEAGDEVTISVGTVCVRYVKSSKRPGARRGFSFKQIIAKGATKEAAAKALLAYYRYPASYLNDNGLKSTSGDHAPLILHRQKDGRRHALLKIEPV